MRLLLGRKVADNILSSRQIREVKPKLGVLAVGRDVAASSYIKSIERTCSANGIGFELFELVQRESEIIDKIHEIDLSHEIDGILLMQPLPIGMNSFKIISSISPLKDIDCSTPENLGSLFMGFPRFVPCTALAIQRTVLEYGYSFEGKDVVILGRSNLIGKPLAALLVQKNPGGNATVTLCHTKTRNLADITRRADILISAIGRAEFITSEFVKEDSIVIDAGINKGEGGIVGDVDFKEVRDKVEAITPVPGGIGSVTTALIENLVRAKISLLHLA